MNKCKLIIMLLMASTLGSHAQWSLTGNAGTTPGTNFIGTTDNKALQFKTNNATRMTIAGGGKIGIGITSPVFKLDVNGDCRINTAPQNTTYNSLILSSTTTNTSYDKYEALKLSNAGFFAGASTSIGFYNGAGTNTGKITSTLVGIGVGSDMLFSVADANGILQPRVNIDASGNMNVGSTSLPAQLVVNSYLNNFGMINNAGTVSFATYNEDGTGAWLGTVSNHDLQFYTNNNYTQMTLATNGNVGIGTTAPHAQLQLGSQLNNRRIILWESANNDHQFAGFGMNANTLRYQVEGLGGSHVFYAANSATASNELMRITGTGKVGIGTSTPSESLTVQTPTLSYGITHTDGTAKLSTYIGTGAGIGLGGWIGTQTNHPLYFYTNSGTASMTITPTGSVAIGGTASTNYKLTVRGSVICTDLRVQLQPFPDYVFATDYKMLPLNELENYVTKNNHLPNMPTATEVEEQEVTVGQLQLKLVEKVEELTLYVIELNKKNEQLQKDNAALVQRINAIEKK